MTQKPTVIPFEEFLETVPPEIRSAAEAKAADLIKHYKLAKRADEDREQRRQAWRERYRVPTKRRHKRG